MMAVITSTDGIIRYASPSLLEKTGYSKEEIIGMNFCNLIGSAGKSLPLPEKKSEKHNISNQWRQITVATKGKGHVCFSVSTDYCTWGDMEAIALFMQETSPSMEEKTFYGQVLDILPDPVFAIDCKGNVTLWNKAIEQLTRVKKEEILGKGDYAYALPFYGERVPSLVDLALKPDPQTEKKYKSFHRYEDNSVEGEIHVSSLDYYDWTKAFPIYDEKGNLLGAASISRDITDRIKAQRELEFSQKRFKELFDNSPDAIAYFDKNHFIQDINPAFTQLFGYTLEECRGINLDEIVTRGEDIQRAAKITYKLFEEGIADLEDFRYRKSGEPVLVGIRGVLVRIDGEVVGGYGIYSDITERIRYKEDLESANAELEASLEELTAVEEELRNHYEKLLESEEKYKALVTRMQQGLALLEAVYDKCGNVVDFQFLDMNESFEGLLEKKRDEVIGRTLLQILPTIEDYWMQKLKHVLGTGEAIRFEDYVQELNTYHEVVAYRPKPRQIALIITNVTERKLAEEALQASELTFRTLFEGSSDPILILDEYKFADCNPATVKILGYPGKESIVGKTPWEISPETQPDGTPSRKKAMELAAQAQKKGKCRFEWWHKKSDGTVFPVEVMLTSIMLHGKKVLHAVIRDISDRKQMEEKLKYLSFHDQLTGLYNRRFFEEELKRLDTPRNLPLTIVMADVNGLKLTNDAFGHAMGDELLKKAAEVLRKACRTDDIVARIGGDEFSILLPRTDASDGEQIVERIKNLTLKEEVASIKLSVSFGWETKTDSTEKIQDIIKKADDNMYKKKLYESPSMRSKSIDIILRTLHEKNKMEEEHSKRVAQFCERMGKALGLSADENTIIRTAGLLHDIGKIAIDDKLLSKRGRLTDFEREEVRRHSEVGYRILSSANEMTEIAEYVIAHHERWDGKGYPKGLKGTDIPLQSRIIAIADAFDAMTSVRNYRNALPEETAVRELINNAGTQFDPHLVKIFIEKVLGVAAKGV
ncbi:MAG: GGDEF domain protein [Firmicutes bacterium]|nr:GGDEF domain protein [Bacillota bacterium]